MPGRFAMFDRSGPSEDGDDLIGTMCRVSDAAVAG
jgi:hypothetical protein